MEIAIRQTNEADWSDLKRIRLLSLQESPQSFGLTYGAVAAYTEDQWKDRAGNRTPPRYFIAWDGATPVGLVGAVRAGTDFELIAMWVAPSHRGLGIGKSLIGTVLDVAVSENEPVVGLYVSPSNTEACTLYQAMGFRFVQQYEVLESFPQITVQRMLAKLPPGAHGGSH